MRVRVPGRRACGYRCGTLLCVVLCMRGSRARVCCVWDMSAGGCRKKRGVGTVFQPPSLKVVVAVSYSPTPSQVQYHRRLRA